jgi:hypothetical protein
MLRGNGLELLEGSVAYRPSSCIAVRIGVDLHHHVRNHARLRQRCWSEIHIDAHGRKIGSALQVPQGETMASVAVRARDRNPTHVDQLVLHDDPPFPLSPDLVREYSHLIPKLIDNSPGGF